MKRMHGILSVGMAVLLLVCALSGCQAKEEGVDVLYRLNKGKESYTLTRVASCPDSLIVNRFNGLPVTAIGDKAFYGASCANLQSLVIGDSVTSIGDYAFWYSPNLSSLELGAGLESIGDSAFEDCDSLRQVKIPDRVYKIGERAFAICNGSLASVEMGKCVSVIGKEAFTGCLSLKAVTLPMSLTSVGQAAFAECPKLTYVFYEGTEADWARVKVGEKNSNLIDHLYFYSAERPTDGGRYWYYGWDGYPTPWG